MNCSFAFIRVHSRLLLFSLFSVSSVYAQQAGSIRGTIFDKEFNAPLAGAQVSMVETGEKITATDEGHYLFNQVQPGNYTLIYSKEGYARQVNANVVVSSGRMTDAEASLSGEFTEMEEFVVQDLQMGGESEAGLLSLRQDSSGIMDAIGSEMMKKAGASTAAAALTLVSGSTVQDGKYAVIRGLADRYTSTLVNGVRLPSADPDKRAVHLDQFPAALIESMQVTKTFTPDQQADASGGGINMVTRAVPQELVASVSYGIEYNDRITGNDKFRTNDRNTMDYWGKPKRNMDLPVRSAELSTVNVNGTFTDNEQLIAGIMKNNLSPVVGTKAKAPGVNQSWSVTLGDSKSWDSGLKVGGLATYSYSHKYSGYFEGQNNSFNLPAGGTKLESRRLSREDKGEEEILTGGFATLGAEFKDLHKLSISYMDNHVGKESSIQRIQDRSTAAEAGLDVNPRFRQEIQYSDRSTKTLQYHGSHVLGPDKTGMAELFGGGLSIDYPVWDWTVAKSSSAQDEPDHTVFDTRFDGASSLYKFVSLKRSWRRIEEESDQKFTNFKIPFEAFERREKGYLKGGFFLDQVDRTFEQDRIFYARTTRAAALNQIKNLYGIDLAQGSPDPLWEVFQTQPGWVGPLDGSATFPDLFGYYIRPDNDPPTVDYTGEQEFKAWYGMADIPIWNRIHVIGGARCEWTSIRTDVDVLDSSNQLILYHIPESMKPKMQPGGKFDEKDLGADMKMYHVLPSLGFSFEPVDQLFLRANWSKTIARPTFKELAPVPSSDDNADYFMGNPALKLSEIENYDLRLEWFPRPGDVVAVSWFKKNITDPIDRMLIEVGGGDLYMIPDNFESATLSGIEFECRQGLDLFHSALTGLSVGGNLTLMESTVKYPEQLINDVRGFSGNTERSMAGQPDYLLNLNTTYDNKDLGFSCGLFYTMTGEKLVSGESAPDGSKYTPSVFEEPVGTLGFTVSQKIFKHFKLGFKASNLLDPSIRQVYRYRGEEEVRREYKRGISYAISIGGEF